MISSLIIYAAEHAKYIVNPLCIASVYRRLDEHCHEINMPIALQCIITKNFATKMQSTILRFLQLCLQNFSPID